MPEYLSLESLGSASIYDMPGFITASQVLDVAFFYKDGVFCHYAGTFGGWYLHTSSKVSSEAEAKTKADKWIKNACL